MVGVYWIDIDRPREKKSRREKKRLNHLACTSVCTSERTSTRIRTPTSACTSVRTSTRTHTSACTSTHTSLSLTGASALLAWSILGMGDLGSSLGSGRRMRSLGGWMEDEVNEEILMINKKEEVKCNNKKVMVTRMR